MVRLTQWCVIFFRLCHVVRRVAIARPPPVRFTQTLVRHAMRQRSLSLATTCWAMWRMVGTSPDTTRPLEDGRWALSDCGAPAASCPREGQAALELADAILHLHDIATAPLVLMSQEAPAGAGEAATATDGMLRDLSQMMSEAHRLRVMSSYAIKAGSWPATA